MTRENRNGCEVAHIAKSFKKLVINGRIAGDTRRVRSVREGHNSSAAKPGPAAGMPPPKALGSRSRRSVTERPGIRRPGSTKALAPYPKGARRRAPSRPQRDAGCL